jgi:TM2 domain-containing membrane protein YozV
MYCKNCGSQISEGYTYCVSCGVGLNMGQSYCSSCGAPMAPEYQNCVNCGAFAGVGAPPGQGGAQVYPVQKSRLMAGLLGVFLGAFGVHNFYLGYTGKAIAQLLISLLSCCILSFVSAIWGLIEGIMILVGSINTDAGGAPLGE